MIALLIAYFLNSPVTADVAFRATVAIETAEATAAVRADKTAKLSAWLDQMDASRDMAMGRKVSPFADDAKASPFNDRKPDPFDAPPRLLWWATSEDRTGKW